jgi:predicted MFS family arabinose efflux permease
LSSLPVSQARPDTETAVPTWLVLLLAIACGATVANLYYAQPLLPELETRFGIDAVIAGALITVTQLGYAASLLLVVPLGDRLEKRQLTSWLLVFTTIALVVSGLAPNYPVLLIGSLVSSATSVVVQILVPFAADLAPERVRGRIVGRVVSGLLIGVLLSRTAGSFLAEAAGWRAVYLTSAALMAVLAVALRLALPRRKPATTLPYGQLLRSTVRLAREHAPLRRRALYQSAMFGVFSAFWTTISFVLTGPSFHYSEFAVGVFALVGVGGAAIAPLAGRWADHGLTRPMTAVAFVGAAVAFVIGGLGQHSVIALGATAVLLDMAVQTSMVLGQHTIYRLDPTARARLNSAFMATFFVGGAAGSLIGSFAFHAGGWLAVSVFGAVLPLLALVYWTTDRSRLLDN